MRSKIFTLFVCFVLILLCSCNIDKGDINENNESSSADTDVLVQLIKLQSRIEEYERKNDEAYAEIQKLKAEISLLKNGADSEDTVDTSQTEDASKYLYTVKDGAAIITGYTGKETYIVIPSHIDGYAVEGIGESAFSYSKLTSVIISEGVKNIGWFAFYAVPSLTSITLPSSVTDIGYSAFEGASSSFSMYCHESTYSHDYAKSYGISYVII